MKQYEWKDVTDECGIEMFRAAAGIAVRVLHNGICIGLLWNKETNAFNYCAGYKSRWNGYNAFRIERWVEVEAWVPQVGDRVRDLDNDKSTIVAISCRGEFIVEYDNEDYGIDIHPASILTPIKDEPCTR